MKLGIRIGLWVIVAVLTGCVYNSIKSKIDFEEETKRRRDHVIERLKDIRTAQIAHKTVYNKYARSFKQLLNFVNKDSFLVIMANGTVPDTLSEEEAVQLKIVTRDTSYVNVRDSIFSNRYLKEHIASFSIDSLPYVPFGAEAEKFEFEAGEVEKGKVMVQVFRIFAAFGIIYTGLNTENEAIDLEEGLAVGSMSEPSTSGNWGE